MDGAGVLYLIVSRNFPDERGIRAGDEFTLLLSQYGELQWDQSVSLGVTILRDGQSVSSLTLLSNRPSRNCRVNGACHSLTRRARGCDGGDCGSGRYLSFLVCLVLLLVL